MKEVDASAPRPNKMQASRLLTRVTSFYLKSNRFNGMPISHAAISLRTSIDAVCEEAAVLIASGVLSLNVGDVHPNPHIKALDPQPKEAQLQRLREARNGCLYPEHAHLKNVVDRTKYVGRPFTLRLALGEPQLRHAAFDLTVLEFYRNDPRYTYGHGDTHGNISIRDKYYRTRKVKRRDQILLDTFGFAYNSRMDRAVASFLWYLSELSPEHQSLWQAKILKGNYRLHPNYFRTEIVGDFPETTPIFYAFLEEIRVVNAMAKAMGRPPLFKTEIPPDEKPREFTFLIRPTTREFDAFKQMLDKFLSDNINVAFFGHDVVLEDEIPRGHGRVEVRRKGTLRILEEWLRSRVRFSDPSDMDRMFVTLKAVRAARNKPAHSIDDNEFDQKIFRLQRKLICEAYDALRTLRLILANHRAAKAVEVPRWLYEGKICTY